MNTGLQLIGTPIAKKYRKTGPDSKRDYEEQCRLTAQGTHCWCWDDAPSNSARSGDYFVFKFYKNKVILHRIEDVKDPSERLISWASNVGQGDRKVLILSNPFHEMTWDEWISIGGCADHMGTQRYDLKKYPSVQRVLTELQSSETI